MKAIILVHILKILILRLRMAPGMKAVIYSAHHENSNIAFADGLNKMSVDTKYDRKFGIGIRNLQ